jgi:hypothetical protein
MSARSWRARADAPANKGGRCPPETLTPAEVAATIGRCSPKAPTASRSDGARVILGGSWRVYLAAVRPVYGRGG